MYGIQMKLTFKLAHNKKQWFYLRKDQIQFVAPSLSLENGEL